MPNVQPLKTVHFFSLKASIAHNVWLSYTFLQKYLFLFLAIWVYM